MASIVKPVMWTLEDGLTLLRALQDDSRDYGYHLCIGGGVVNAGHSRKDLDLYFIPLDNGGTNVEGLRSWLGRKLGEGSAIADPNYPENPNSVYAVKLKYGPLGKRIDVFVMKG